MINTHGEPYTRVGLALVRRVIRALDCKTSMRTERASAKPCDATCTTWSRLGTIRSPGSYRKRAPFWSHTIIAFAIKEQAAGLNSSIASDPG